MFLDLLEKRRSIRDFKDQLVEDIKVEALIEAALRSPSSVNRRPWHFAVTKNTEQIEKLSVCKEHGASFLKKAPLAIVVAADPKKCDVWVEDCSIASILIQLCATDLGLGSCWVQVRERKDTAGNNASDNVIAAMGLPEDYEVLSIIGVGYPVSDKEGHSYESLAHEQVSK
ncbi:MAG: nitroreductase family protein [Desulfotalea sp.]